MDPSGMCGGTGIIIGEISVKINKLINVKVINCLSFF